LRKLPTHPELDGPRRPRRGLRATLAMVAVMAAAPLAIDGTRVCLAAWRSLYGPATPVSTPAFDWVNDTASEVLLTIDRPVSAAFHRLPWRADLVVLIAVVWAAVNVVLMRRGPR